MLAVALQTGRHVVLEGPPGTGKSTLLRAVAAEVGAGVVFVEGNAELTPARLVGQHDPAVVLTEGYRPTGFVDGPLLLAMRAGSLLYLEELNRVPEETLNVLITVLAEREIHVPRLGRVEAEPGFRLVAAMNPFDAVGTARVSQAIADRMCRIVLGYQSEAGERAIVAGQTGGDGASVALAVGLARATRRHPDLRHGSSVRGAIDMVLLLQGLRELRGEARLQRDTARDAARAALSGRVHVHDGCGRSAEEILDELLDRLLPADDEPGCSPPDRGEPDPGRPGAAPPAGSGKAPAPAAPRRADGGSVLEGDAARDALREAARRTDSRRDLAARHRAFGAVSPQVGQLAEEALADALDADPDAAAALLADLARATDPALRVQARRVAARVFVSLATGTRETTRGTARLVSQPGGGEGDLDLDRTLERLGGARPRSGTDLVTRRWRGRRRALALLVDASGSMRGAAVATAAVAAAGVVLAAGERLRPSVLTFAHDVVVVSPQGASRPVTGIVEDLLALRGHGTTDLAAGLRAAAAQLARAHCDRREVVLLSDCLATTGADPAGALAGIDRLHVLLPATSPEATAAATALARRTGGRVAPVTSVRQVAPALTRLLG